VSKLTTDVVTYRYLRTEASNRKSKYAYRKIFFYKKALFVRKYRSQSFVLLNEDCWEQYWHRAARFIDLMITDGSWIACCSGCLLWAVKLDWLRPSCNLLLTKVWLPSDKLRPCTRQPVLSVIAYTSMPVFCQRRVPGSCRPAGSLFEVCTWNGNPGFPFFPRMER